MDFQFPEFFQNLDGRSQPKLGEAVQGPSGSVTLWVNVSPGMAVFFLGHNRPNNRRMIRTWVQRMAVDMSAGHFIPTHEGIAFDQSDYLCDGQNRLQAIIDSGQAQWLLVTFNLPDNAMEVINRGKARSLSHALQVMGVVEASSHRFVAIARAMCAGPTTLRTGQINGMVITDIMMREFIQRQVEPITFAMTTLSKSSGPAPVGGLLARAFYHTDPDSLKRFVSAMDDRIATEDSRPGDRSARALSAYLHREGASGGSDFRTSLYRKAQNALHCYLEDKPLSKLTERADDLFPLDDPLAKSIVCKGK